MIERLNAAFDRLPGPELRLGQRAIPMFLLCGVAGLAIGTFLFVALSALAGADVAVALGLVPIAVFVSLAWAFVRMRHAGFERWVLLEHLLLDMAVVAAALWLVRQPIAPWFDRMFPGFCVLFAFGRIGCASAGCCFGHHASVGIDANRHDGTPQRRFPVQLLEAGAWIGCSALGATLALRSAPGVAFGTTALIYAIVRFFLEGLRADPRPTLFGVTESRWLSVALGIVALVVLERTGHLSESGLRLGGVGLALTTVLWLGAPVWFASSKHDEHILVELAELGRAFAEGGPHRTVQIHELGRFTVASSWNEADTSSELFVSIQAHHGRRPSPVWAELAFEALSRGLGFEGSPAEPVETSPGQFAARFARRASTTPTPTPTSTRSTTTDLSWFDGPVMPQRTGTAANDAADLDAVRSEYFERLRTMPEVETDTPSAASSSPRHSRSGR